MRLLYYKPIIILVRIDVQQIFFGKLEIARMNMDKLLTWILIFGNPDFLSTPETP